MINKRLEDIIEEDIENLITIGERESKTIEYKSQLPGDTDAAKKDFLGSVTSLANALGGDLIFGIEENRETGEPLNHDGIACDNIDQLILRLNQIIRDGIEPIIPINLIRPGVVPQLNNRIILIYRISKSWQRPHRIKYKTSHKFYTRASNGKVLMDIQELRSEFLNSEYILDRIKSFRRERLAVIIANDSFVPLYPTAKLIVHIIPLISFETSKKLEISVVSRKHWAPIYCGSGYNSRINIDGLLSFKLMNNGISSTYVEVFRNGIVEAVESYMLKPDEHGKLIPSPELETEIMQALKVYLHYMQELEIEKPYYIFITMYGVKGYKKPLFGRRYTEAIDRDILYLPEVLVSDEDLHIATLLKPPFDALYNALGLEKNSYYEDDGTWNEHKQSYQW
ncbi:MAG: AlbA family DNA-binding domain-containing protein [Promethearchaeota archaeon]